MNLILILLMHFNECMLMHFKCFDFIIIIIIITITDFFIIGIFIAIICSNKFPQILFYV